jgi:hypothetical protein
MIPSPLQDYLTSSLPQYVVIDLQLIIYCNSSYFHSIYQYSIWASSQGSQAATAEFEPHRGHHPSRINKYLPPQHSALSAFYTVVSPLTSLNHLSTKCPVSLTICQVPCPTLTIIPLYAREVDLCIPPRWREGIAPYKIGQQPNGNEDIQCYIQRSSID